MPRTAHCSRHERAKHEIGRPQVYIFGEVEGAVPCWPLVRLYCSWRLVFDSTKWVVIQGETEGETFDSGSCSQGFCVWNQPIAVHLACRSLQGWPRLELVVRGSDSHGRQRLAGYGSCAVPLVPGAREVLCRCWRLTGDGMCARLRAFLVGIVPELLVSSMLSDHSRSRPTLKTEDSVDVLVRLSIVHQNFPQNSVETGRP
mmetsp:Transcript_35703/g.83006  ORF Transcript_35703/g.83006 Transcript_35703/m.83006 type:complete len:201 (+) Transcript_35703:46-648(+)|eukprot:CAMPEP_0171108240 /NCGR_PEP_ID=MMETSP0766_2-20121228/68468_1 /TAXON_ID=439317 /ORGANISM="Gambierdiscus australes, Strain CAWD 149" /LENGTH=200 /DNA_ID=CAMNT_0011569707 /DNA_START=45 /DNA_END=647 /DNA_ORIENTATION=+